MFDACNRTYRVCTPLRAHRGSLEGPVRGPTEDVTCPTFVDPCDASACSMHATAHTVSARGLVRGAEVGGSQALLRARTRALLGYPTVRHCPGRCLTPPAHRVRRARPTLLLSPWDKFVLLAGFIVLGGHDLRAAGASGISTCLEGWVIAPSPDPAIAPKIRATWTTRTSRWEIFAVFGVRCVVTGVRVVLASRWLHRCASWLCLVCRCDSREGRDRRYARPAVGPVHSLGGMLEPNRYYLCAT